MKNTFIGLGLCFVVPDCSGSIDIHVPSCSLPFLLRLNIYGFLAILTQFAQMQIQSDFETIFYVYGLNQVELLHG